MKKIGILDQKIIQNIVAGSIKKYKKTYLLLDQYDKNPQSAPSYEVERRDLQRVFQELRVVNRSSIKSVGIA